MAAVIGMVALILVIVAVATSAIIGGILQQNLDVKLLTSAQSVRAGTVATEVLDAGRQPAGFLLVMRGPTGDVTGAHVLSKAQILDRVWNYDFGGQANVVELYVSFLRKKIDAGRSPMIHTMRGAGYVLKPGE